MLGTAVIDNIEFLKLFPKSRLEFVIDFPVEFFDLVGGQYPRYCFVEFGQVPTKHFNKIIQKEFCHLPGDVTKGKTWDRRFRSP